MAPPHETFFFLTGGTGPRPTYAAFLAAAAQRTAKTKEKRRDREKRGEQRRELQGQREKASNEVSGVGVRVMRLLGLRMVREKGVPTGRNDQGKHTETETGGSVGKQECNGSAEKSVGDVLKSKVPGKDMVENGIAQSGGGNNGGTDTAAHSRAPEAHCDNAANKSMASCAPDGDVETLLGADKAISI
ncbi:hypothetical protein V492_06481 [Pseudogymnoascus sp. VKM F-4246]|nr:hypothetical protein V492_06481 [Pseudogymnoascus sp. VKM F-4246]